jgi:F-type H+-transporting ATPase subunit a
LGKLLSNPKVLVALIAVLVVFFVALLGGALGAVFGGGFLGSPIPHIQLAAETVVKIDEIGGYSLNNTAIMFWAAGLLLLFLSWRATRRMKDVPGRLQGLFEAIVEFFDSTADSVAGGARAGRRYLPVMLSIFLIVLFSNWLGILPGVGTIGQIETVKEFVEHRVEQRTRELDKSAKSDTKLVNNACLRTSVEDHHERALQEVLCQNAGEHFVVFDGSLISLGRTEATKVRLDQVAEVEKFLAHQITVADVERQIEEGKVLQLSAKQETDCGQCEDLVGKQAGILVPYLRGSSTDLNTTLAVAIFAMVTVQIWGIRALGARTYAGKFFVNPMKHGPIMAFVGVLEAFAEIARTISFTFRLFGNMFAGEVLLIAMGFLLPLIGMLPFLGLELFVGLIQAFVFAMLALVFGVSASAHHGEELHEEAARGGEQAHTGAGQRQHAPQAN